jgi:hypothetical protein
MRRYGRFGCLLAALWLALAMAGASPQLHHTLHEDANDAEHSCVIEHVGEGAFLFSPEPVLTVRQHDAVVSGFAASRILVTSRDYRLTFSRGPPPLPHIPNGCRLEPDQGSRSCALNLQLWTEFFPGAEFYMQIFYEIFQGDRVVFCSLAERRNGSVPGDKLD